MRRSFGVPLILALSACLVFIAVAARRFHAAPAPVFKEKAVAFDDTALRKLARLLPPPEKLTHPGSPAQWRAAEKALGGAFPEEYKRFVGLYGRITVNNAYLRFFIPFGDDEDFGLQPNLEVVREGEKFSASLKLGYHPVWPEEGGLLPIASTANGDYLAYRTKGKPDEWTVAALSHESAVEEHPYGLVEFMTRLAEGRSASKMLQETGDLKPPLTLP